MLHMPTASTALDPREFCRFLVSGALATLGNLGAVWITRPIVPFSAALICGICVGMTISFVMAKFFAFRSRDLSRTRGEARRFVVVYGLGLLLYWCVAVVVRALLSEQFRPAVADMAGVVVGAAAMVVTGYFGHRFLTFRSNARE
jgi:putative flippase GtrA